MSTLVHLVETDDGARLALDLAEQELDLLRTLVAQLGELVRDAEHPDASGDPAMERLFPAGYRDDAAAAAEFAEYTRRGLAEHKSAGAARVAAALATGTRVVLARDEAAAWLPTLTDLRLVLAERLGIRGDDDRPEGLMAEVYDWLGALQWNLVEAIDAMEGT